MHDTSSVALTMVTCESGRPNRAKSSVCSAHERWQAASTRRVCARSGRELETWPRSRDRGMCPRRSSRPKSSRGPCSTLDERRRTTGESIPRLEKRSRNLRERRPSCRKRSDVNAACNPFCTSSLNQSISSIVVPRRTICTWGQGRREELWGCLSFGRRNPSRVFCVLGCARVGPSWGMPMCPCFCIALPSAPCLAPCLHRA